VPLLLVLLILVTATWFLPPMIEQTAYSWNRGIERAKADVARKLLADLPQPERRIAWVAKAVTPSVVGIYTVSPAPHPARGRFGNSDRNSMVMDVGSGVVVDNTGYVLTNYHVVANAEHIQVRFNDGRTVNATIIGQDKITDLAVLKIEAEKLQSVVWGDSTKVEVGDQVVAIGSPYNLQATVTSGIISATERYNPVSDQRGNVAQVQEYLQTDVAINPGNSGGALVNMSGELIGINTMIYSETGGNLGIGFAIPSLMAKTVYEEIVKNGAMKHGWLGIYMEPVKKFDQDKMHQDTPHGVVVAEFLPNSPAKESGLELGDVIVRWGETTVNDPLHLSHIIVLSRPGTTENVEIFRNGKKMTIEITLGMRPVNIK
jgi:serine protease Do